jgi:membrane protease YdiL (CAAX protease family)
MDWEHFHLLPLFGLVSVTAGYLGYHYISGSRRLIRFITGSRDTGSAEIYRVLFQKLTGFVFLGVLPAVAMLLVPITFEQIGVTVKNSSESLFWIAILGTLILIVNFFAARKEDNLRMYPQIRISEWTPRIVFLSSAGWVLYLMGYEFMFRGILLFTCIPVIGVWPSVALNVAIYAFVHMTKGMKETLASIPMGILLCILTLKTETIWVAFFVHVILALSNEYFSIYYHPDMHFQKRGEKRS